MAGGDPAKRRGGDSYIRRAEWAIANKIIRVFNPGEIVNELKPVDSF